MHIKIVHSSRDIRIRLEMRVSCVNGYVVLSHFSSDPANTLVGFPKTFLRVLDLVLIIHQRKLAFMQLHLNIGELSLSSLSGGLSKHKQDLCVIYITRKHLWGFSHKKERL